MKNPPLRWLLLVPIVLTLSVGGIALGVYVERSVGSDLVARVDDELARVQARARPPAGRPDAPAPNQPEDSGEGDLPLVGAVVPLEFTIDATGTIVVQVTGDPVFDQLELRELYGIDGIRTVDSEPRYRVATMDAQDGQTLVVGLSLESVDESLASLRRNLIVGGFVLFVAQVLAIWLIARAVARPVTRLSRVAHDIASGDLDADVGPPNGSQETAELATDLRQMLVRLRSTIAEQQQSAAEANRARADMQRFMADASHELRTPLTALKGYSDLYRGGMLDTDGLDRAMSRIGSESQRLTDLVVGLLDLMKPDDDASAAAVDLTDTVAKVTADITAAFPDRTITLLDDHGDAAVMVAGTASRLHQAVLNLVANACQHTPVHSPIELQLTSDGDQANVLVIDHGEGIGVGEADRLFVAFARGDESRSRKSHDGAGLGLALVRRVSEQHGGAAWVRDTPGGGATFGITLPVERPHEHRVD